ncbi:MAG: potassium channel protein [Phycisphaerae bacterium]|nr:potassium channel protein [Phycisphaerae bacterium]
MKYLTAQIAFLLRQRKAKRNIVYLLRFVAVLVGLVLLYSVVFHYLMELEGREHSWLTGLYWTLTVMSTLGFGDITFHSDLGRAFSMVVLLSGIVFLLILLPFTFIQFFYAPWMEAQAAARAPSALPEQSSGHVLLTSHDPVTTALIKRFVAIDQEYALVVPDLKEALRLHDMGVRVVVGDLDDPETYRRLRADRAAMLATTQSDVLNTNVSFTARGVAPELPIVATANSAAAEDILYRGGATRVLQLHQMMGQALARCTIGGDAVSHVVAQVDEVLIAEASAARTPLVGKSLRDNRLTDLGVSVIGVWERGRFEFAAADTVVNPHSILVLTGSAQQLQNYDEAFAIYNQSGEPALILGGGRVGRATARALAERGIDSRIVEQSPDRVRDKARTIVGNAAELEVLEQAGIRKAPTVLITTHDDSLNIYLTIYVRKLRPDIQVISRCTHERNVATLHRAGADHVLSYANMGSNTIVNLLKRSRILTVAEGLDIFRLPAPPALHGKPLAESGVRERTGSSVVAVRSAGALVINPPAQHVLSEGDELVLVGGIDAEARFRDEFAGE